MTSPLLFLAGEKAFDQIQKTGLLQDNIKAVMGASGAAKWLVLHGLDKAVFSQWFKDRKKPLYLFGTSVGAWKFAAAAQHDNARAFDNFARGYIHQIYEGKITPEKITRETLRVFNAFLPQKNIRQILSHPSLRLNFSAVRCRGLLTKSHPFFVSAGLLLAFLANLKGRRLQGHFFERTVFFDQRFSDELFDLSEFKVNKVPLSLANLKPALIASGSIPLIMEPIKNIPAAPAGSFLDGGVLDYHPALSFLEKTDNLILYPHFYPYLIPGWFDKRLPRRRASGRILDNTLIVAPSPDFVAGLPMGKIPDRHDFVRLKGRDSERIRLWKKTVEMCQCLGDTFLEAATSGKIKALVQKIPAG